MSIVDSALRRRAEDNRPNRVGRLAPDAKFGADLLYAEQKRFFCNSNARALT